MLSMQQGLRRAAAATAAEQPCSLRLGRSVLSGGILTGPELHYDSKPTDSET